MMDPLAERGHAERFKASIHFALFALGSMCLGYNAMAYGQRRERHLVTNVVVYAGLLCFEARQVIRHLTEDV